MERKKTFPIIKTVAWKKIRWKNQFLVPAFYKLFLPIFYSRNKNFVVLPPVIILNQYIYIKIKKKHSKRF